MIERAFGMVLASLLVAAPAAAQSVDEVLEFLVTNVTVETGSVERDLDAAQAASDTISGALLANLATLPVTTSSGGFVYRLNPELGTVERASPSFGPFFIERAITSGRRAASVGLTFQHLRFSSLDGSDLRDGTLTTTANQFADEPEPFDVDQLALSIDADITTLHGSLGVTDRVELGASVPLIVLRLRGSRVNTYRGTAFTQATATATAVGLADVVVRGKVNVFDEDGMALATAVDVRLPTGREEDLLGAGSLSTRVTVIGSVERGAASAHANAGLTFGGIAREISFGGAAALAAAERLTITGELLGRWMDRAGHIRTALAPHPTLAGVNTIRLTPSGSNLLMMSVAPGFKWNVSDTWVLVANVTVPITTGGLTAPMTPFVGLDYALDW